VKDGFFLRMKPFGYVLSDYTNSENALAHRHECGAEMIAEIQYRLSCRDETEKL
jgi:cysteine synthase